MTSIELMQKRAEAIARAREINNLAERENRALSDEELNNYDQAMRDALDFKKRADRAAEQERLAEELAQSTGTRAAHTYGAAGGDEDQNAREQRAAFEAYLRTGEKSRALQVDQDSKGGYLVPQMLATEVIKGIDNLVFVRRLATVQQLPNADSLGIPYLTADPDDADWTTELGSGSEDSAMTFGKRELRPHPLAKRLKVSKTLLRKAANVEGLVLERLAYKFGVAQEKGFLTGNGAGRPLGIFTASNDGIDTSRDVSSGNATTSIKVDGLLSAKYALKQQYHPRAQWAMHRDAVAQIAKLKDGEGRYLWQESVAVGQPDRLLGFPVNMSEYAPNTFTTGLYVGVLGDFSKYYIADSLAVSIQRLTELYAETNQDGFIGRLECDGMPVLPEAFVRVKLA